MDLIGENQHLKKTLNELEKNNNYLASELDAKN